MTNVAIADRIAIEDLFTGVSRAIDGGRVGDLVHYLTEDAVFDMGGHRLEGRDTIIAALSQHTQSRAEATRHVWGNLSIDQDDGETLRTTAVMMVFSAALDGASDSKTFRGGDVADTVVRTDGGMRLKERRMIVLFPF